MVGLVFSPSNFFINKIYQANKLSVEKYLLAQTCIYQLKFEKFHFINE